MTILPVPIQYWKCPSCGFVDRTQTEQVITQFHNCPALGGLNVPLAQVTHPDDTPDAVHRLNDREDYMGADAATASPIMSTHLERADGSYDTNVYAPTATFDIE